MTHSPRVPVSLRLLQGTAFVSSFDRFVMPPMLVAVADDLGVPLAAVVQAAGVYFLAYGLGQPFWGAVSDRFGRVATMRAALLMGGLMAGLSALSWSSPSLVVLRGLAGFFFGAAFPSTLIYLGDTVPAPERQHAVARLMTGVALGTALASAAAGAVADASTWRLAFAASAAASLALVVLLHRLVEPESAPRSFTPWAMFGVVRRSRSTTLLLLFAFVEGALLLGGLTLVPPALESAGAAATIAGGVTALYGLSVLLASAVVGPLSGRWHPSWLIASGAVCIFAAWTLLAASRDLGPAMVAVLLVGVAWSAMHTSLQTWATQVQPLARATVVSLFAGALFAGSATAALVTGDLAESGEFSLIFAACAVVSVPLGLSAAVARWRWRPVEPTVGSRGR